MRSLTLAIPLVLTAATVTAAPTEDWSARFAADGPAATARAIEALAAPSPDDLLALAATRFLGGVERALNARWEIGEGDSILPLPVFRLPLAPNPAPAPFDPAMVETTLAGLSADMDAAREALVAIPADASLELELRLEDLWLDIDGSGERSAGEGVLELGQFALDTGSDVPASIPVTFDTADAAWLSAYTHLLSATSDFVRAFAPTEPIRRIHEGRMAMVAAGVPGPLEMIATGDPGTDAARYPNQFDAAAMALLALRQQPLAEHTRAARDHLRAMIAENRRFWELVALETDDRQEWIPNDNQTAALGVAFPRGIDVAWLDVLADGERLLAGDLLVPTWTPAAGFDLAAWLENPGPVDLVEWLHGTGMMPWLHAGPTIGTESWMALEQLTTGNAALFAVFIN